MRWHLPASPFWFVRRTADRPAAARLGFCLPPPTSFFSSRLPRTYTTNAPPPSATHIPLPCANLCEFRPIHLNTVDTTRALAQDVNSESKRSLNEVLTARGPIPESLLFFFHAALLFSESCLERPCIFFFFAILLFCFCRTTAPRWKGTACRLEATGKPFRIVAHMDPLRSLYSVFCPGRYLDTVLFRPGRPPWSQPRASVAVVGSTLVTKQSQASSTL